MGITRKEANDQNMKHPNVHDEHLGGKEDAPSIYNTDNTRCHIHRTYLGPMAYSNSHSGGVVTRQTVEPIRRKPTCMGENSFDLHTFTGTMGRSTAPRRHHALPYTGFFGNTHPTK